MLAFNSHHCTHCHLSWPEQFSLFNLRTFCLCSKPQSYLQGRHLFFFSLFFSVSDVIFEEIAIFAVRSTIYNQDATKNAGIHI